MRIAIVGTGSIGSTFAFHLATHGHDVTVVARGQRLEQLQRDQAIVTVKGDRATVRPLPRLDDAPYDLVLVTLLAPQVDAVMPELKASPAAAVMFMFNTFESLEPLRDAVGANRFAFGFPSIFASLPEGRLKADVYASGQVTTVTDARWAKVFTEAGIPTVVHPDLHSWLRSHAALVVPLMSMAMTVVAQNGAGVTWTDARRFAAAWSSGFRLVRALGNAVTPGPVVAMAATPEFVVAGLLWALSRTQTIRDLGALGPGEARMLIDSMVAAAPADTSALSAIRP